MKNNEEILIAKISELATNFTFDVYKIAKECNVKNEKVFLLAVECLIDFYKDGHLLKVKVNY